MTELRDALDDLVTHVPPHVVTAGVASRAWARGRRRRLRHRLGGTAIVSAVAAVVTMTVAPLAGGPGLPLPLGDGGGPRVDGYPQRIGHQWWVRDLPDRPGPVAALVRLRADPPDDGEPEVDRTGLFAISATGHRWRVPTDAAWKAEPAISPDGRRIGYLAAREGPYVIHDLVTGARVRFPLSDGVRAEPGDYVVYSQYPAFWSPDGTRLLLGGNRGRAPGELVLDMDGSITVITGPGVPAGWAGDDTLAWHTMEWTVDEAGEDRVASVTAHLTTVAGDLLRSVPLRPLAPWFQGPAAQWGGVVSPDGSELLIIEDVGTGQLRRFSLPDGAEITEPLPADIALLCGAGWAGSGPIVAVDLPDEDPARDNTTTAVWEEQGQRTLTVVEPGLRSDCIVWAADALAGEPHGLFGTSMAWWTWWWRELAAIAILLIGVAAVWLRWRRRRGPAR